LLRVLHADSEHLSGTHNWPMPISLAQKLAMLIFLTQKYHKLNGAIPKKRTALASQMIENKLT